MSEFHFGDMVVSKATDAREDAKMVVTTNAHCRFHPMSGPCLVLTEMDGDNDDSRSGWCYSPDYWIKMEDS
jgi:hypothetical protein